MAGKNVTDTELKAKADKTVERQASTSNPAGSPTLRSESRQEGRVTQHRDGEGS